MQIYAGTVSVFVRLPWKLKSARVFHSDLHHNEIADLEEDTFQGLMSLHSL